ncbi:NAC domain-containing protein [Canna indica]|uniref:NAC domain-containing protein n=1 Tax=Canna indica TaxID=4628 RepID=A0AAQ3QS91_9LILI|nr:NAC domain-containing protein [Canna indica]
MSALSLPPGFRFRPTDDELVGYYLKRKVDGLSIELEIIPVIELYKYEPWELPDKSFLPKRDMEWFFFCPRDRKYPNGSRTNRATGCGYWKATGKDRKIACEPSVYGLRKTLVFYYGRAPGGERTKWVMHEYRLCEDLFQGSSNFVESFALCRVVQRNDPGLKTGDLPEEPIAKRFLSSVTEFGHEGNFGRVLSSSEENSVTKVFDISGDSTHITSLDSGGEVDLQPIMIGSNRRGFWEPPTASKKTSLVEESMDAGSTIIREASPSSNLSSSSIHFMEEDFMVDESVGSPSLLTFPSPAHCIEVYGNAEDIAFHSLELDAPRYLTASHNGFGTETWNPIVPASICRQASEGEDASLWLQEDNLVIVI